MISLVNKRELVDYLSGIWLYRYFWYSLVDVDLRKRYRGTVLGIGWSLLKPIAMTTVICTMFAAIFNVPIREYAPFLMAGFTFWCFISESVIDGCETFRQGEAFIRQQRLPLAIFPLRTVVGAGFHSLIALGVVIFMVWILQGFGNVTDLPLLLPAIAMLFLLGWSLATLAGLANTFFPDSKHLLEIVLQLFFYLTPIIYPPVHLTGRFGASWLLKLNPLAYFLEMVRQPVLVIDKAEALTWHGYAVAGGLTVVAVILAIACLRRLESRLVFWL